MNWPSHLAYPYIIANLIAYSLGTKLTWQHNVVLLIFAYIPDIDYGFHWIYTKLTGRHFNPGVNHHQWASHWPVSYVPLAMLFIIFPNTYTALMVFGVLSHLVMDTIACAWGVMWLYPFSKRWFNYFAARWQNITDGLAWKVVWNQTNFRWVELAALSIVAVHFVFF